MGLVNLDNVKLKLKITDDSQDILLQRYIDTVSGKVEKIIGRPIELDTYSETYTGTATTSLMLRNYPIVSIEKIVVDEEEIDDYTILNQNKQPGKVYREGLWEIKGYENQLTNIVNGSDVRHIENIAIDYTAGYSEVPLDIQDIVVEEVKRRYDQVSTVG